MPRITAKLTTGNNNSNSSSSSFNYSSNSNNSSNSSSSIIATSMDMLERDIEFRNEYEEGVIYLFSLKEQYRKAKIFFNILSFCHFRYLFLFLLSSIKVFF
jgi:hypothetical protein